MAPRKDASDAQQAAGIDAFELPKALVTRIAKSVLPPESKLQKDTVAALVRGATVFINYLAATAQDIANSHSRRTIASADVLTALEVLALGDLVPLLQHELDGYRGQKISKNKNAKGKEKETSHESVVNAPEPGDESEEEIDDDLADENEDEPELGVRRDGEAEENMSMEGDEDRQDDDVLSDADIPVTEHPPDNTGDDDMEEIEDVVALEAEELQRDAQMLDGIRADHDEE